MPQIPAYQSERELHILMKISQSIIRTLDFEQVLQIISDGMSELLEIESAAIYLLKSENEIRLSATTPPLAPNMPESLRHAFIADHPHIQKALQSHKPQLIEDAQSAELSPAERAIVEMRQLRSLLYFPFFHEDIVLGVLILSTCNKSRKFNQNEIDFGQTIANQLAVSIQNTQMHAELKEHRNHLEQLVFDKTKDLDAAIEELKAANEELFGKNEIINIKNTELKATLRNLQETQSQLIVAEKMASLGTLTAGIAHEIKNPLNFIVGSYFALEDYFKTSMVPPNETIQLLLTGIKTGTDRINGIVKSLNHFSRENHQMDEKCCINSILDNCLVMLNHQITDTIKIQKDYTLNTSEVKGNVGKLHQAFLNILTNAVQAIEKTGIVRIKTTIEKNLNHLKVEISDNGKGIASENLNSITEPFYTTKAPGKGTGLGLYITHSIIREHEGALAFWSKPGKGTKVEVSLPIMD